MSEINVQVQCWSLRQKLGFTEQIIYYKVKSQEFNQERLI